MHGKLTFGSARLTNTRVQSTRHNLVLGGFKVCKREVHDGGICHLEIHHHPTITDVLGAFKNLDLTERLFAANCSQVGDWPFLIDGKERRIAVQGRLDRGAGPFARRWIDTGASFLLAQAVMWCK
jgi:hypothetical protein